MRRRSPPTSVRSRSSPATRRSTSTRVCRAGARRPVRRLAEVRVALAEQRRSAAGPPVQRAAVARQGAARRQDASRLRRAGPRRHDPVLPLRQAAGRARRDRAAAGAAAAGTAAARTRGRHATLRCRRAAAALRLPLPAAQPAARPRHTLRDDSRGRRLLRPAGPRFAERLDAWQTGSGPRTSRASAWSGRATCITRTIATARSRCTTSPASVSTQARFVSLQNEIREADAAVLKARGDIDWFGAELVDFAETGRARRPARPGGLGRHLGRPSRRGDGQARVAAAAAESGLALAARPGGQPVVRDDAALPPDAARRVERCPRPHRAGDRAALRLSDRADDRRALPRRFIRPEGPQKANRSLRLARFLRGSPNENARHRLWPRHGLAS